MEAVRVFVIIGLALDVTVTLLFVAVALLTVDFVGDALEVLLDDIVPVVVEEALATVGVLTGDAELVLV